jgi:hypothetical protein
VVRAIFARTVAGLLLGLLAGLAGPAGAAGDPAQEPQASQPRARFEETYVSPWAQKAAGQAAQQDNASDPGKAHFQYNLRNNSGKAGVSYDILRF